MYTTIKWTLRPFYEHRVLIRLFEIIEKTNKLIGLIILSYNDSW